MTDADPSTDPDQIRKWWTWQPQATALVVPTTAKVLDAVEAFLRRFVIFPTDDEPVAVALWVLHTYAVDTSEQSPYLAITSPTKRSGKSRVLDVLEGVVANPWRVVTPTEAVVFRKIHRDSPTILLDEADMIFGGKQADRPRRASSPAQRREPPGHHRSPLCWT